MSPWVIFGLGVAVGVVMIFVIAMVVVMLRLSRKITCLENRIQGLTSDAEGDRRNMNERCNQTLRDSKSYADSRIDKVKQSEKVTA